MSANLPASISDIADKFNHTEKDVLRSLKYWEKNGLITLEYNDSRALIGIHLNDLNRLVCKLPEQEETDISSTSSVTQVDSSAQNLMMETSSRFEKPAYSPDQIKAFREQRDTCCGCNGKGKGTEFAQIL